MKITGSYDINADRQTVWEALNDPEVLKDCIPGCDSLEKSADNELSATVTAKVGPVKAKFSGVVELKDLNPPESYRIEGSGKGGAAGFAKGGADVRLAEIEGGGTNLTYDADAQVGGKLAQIGARLIDGTAKKMADQFFAAFRERVEAGASAPAAEAAAADPAEMPAPAETAVEAAPDETAVEAAPAEPEPTPEPTSEPIITPTPEATAAPKPEPAQAASSGSGSGVPAWVWFIGAVGLIFVLVAMVT